MKCRRHPGGWNKKFIHSLQTKKFISGGGRNKNKRSIYQCSKDGRIKNPKIKQARKS